MSLPVPGNTQSDNEELRMLRVARELAMDMHDLGDILMANGVSLDEWKRMEKSPRFLALLTANMSQWNSASNVQERVRLKAAYVLEEYLPSLNKQLHDDAVGLPGKVEAMKLLAKVAGVDRSSAEAGDSAPRFSVTINMGETTHKTEFTLPGNSYSEIENELE